LKLAAQKLLDDARDALVEVRALDFSSHDGSSVEAGHRQLALMLHARKGVRQRGGLRCTSCQGYAIKPTRRLRQ
jgi:hypothetical protein